MIRFIKNNRGPLTIGTLAAIISMAISFVAVVYGFESHLAKSCEKCVKAHESKSVDVVHKDIASRYVTQEDLLKMMIILEIKLAKLQATQQAILDQMKKLTFSERSPNEGSIEKQTFLSSLSSTRNNMCIDNS